MKFIYNLLRYLAAVFLDIIPRDEPHGRPLFEGLARHTWFISFEAVLLRKSGNSIEVFLTQRGLDEAYPGEWHCPGTIFRSTDRDEADAAKRLSQREFKAEIMSFCLVAEDFNIHEKRGHCLHRIYLVETDEEPQAKNGKWFRVDELPSMLVEHHRNVVIPRALAQYNLKNNKI